MTTEWSLCFRSLPLLPPSFSLPLPLPCKASMGNWARHSRRLSRLCPHPPDVSLTPHPPPPKRRTTLPYKFFHDLQRVAVTIITINLIRVSLSPAITICHHSSDSTAPCFPPPPPPPSPLPPPPPPDRAAQEVPNTCGNSLQQPRHQSICISFSWATHHESFFFSLSLLLGIHAYAFKLGHSRPSSSVPEGQVGSRGSSRSSFPFLDSGSVMLLDSRTADLSFQTRPSPSPLEANSQKMKYSSENRIFSSLDFFYDFLPHVVKRGELSLLTCLTASLLSVVRELSSLRFALQRLPALSVSVKGSLMMPGLVKPAL